MRLLWEREGRGRVSLKGTSVTVVFVVIPAKAGIHHDKTLYRKKWILTSTGSVTVTSLRNDKYIKSVSEKRYRDIKILIASPGDVAAERDCAERVISRLEIYDDQHVLLRLLPKRWEFDTASEMGEASQDIIDRQIVDECDCAVCMFWTRIGTPTAVAPGGAVEELERMLSQGKLVMLYFSDAQLPLPSAFDWEQYARLQVWKKSLIDGKRGLIKSYKNVEEFELMLGRELKQQIKAKFATPSSHPTPSPSTSQPTFAETLADYQNNLQQELDTLTLTGSPAFGHIPLKLSETFVSLGLSGSSMCECRATPEGVVCDENEHKQSSLPENVMKQVFFEQKKPLLLIIGDPGSGKTTLMKYYALCCLDATKRAKFGFTEPITVFFLPLRKLKKLKRGYASLEKHLAELVTKSSQNVTSEHIKQCLQLPSTLVLLDGLDEISDVKDRVAACKWISKAVQSSQAKFVVTSRTTGYRKGDGIEITAPHIRADILNFSKDQQKQFLTRWFRAAYRATIRPDSTMPDEWQREQDAKAMQQADELYKFVHGDQEDKKQPSGKKEWVSNKSVQELAGVPLLLQIMAMLKKERNYKPTGRIELYDAALNFMLDFRDRDRDIEPLLDAKDARLVLSPVSLWMQETLQKDEVEYAVMQSQMQPTLDTLQMRVSAADFCEKHLVDRAGLLVSYSEKYYVFRHKTFREYLAGVQLVKKMAQPDALLQLVNHFATNWDWWREPIRFFINQADAEQFDAFMQHLFNSPLIDNADTALEQKQRDLLVTLIEEAPQRKVDALRNKLLDPQTNLSCQHYLLECLKAYNKPEALSVIEEFEQSGLSKEKKSAQPSIFDPLGGEYIRIAAGKFIYSVTEKPTKVGETYFAKYTVTNGQYRRFIGYLAGKEKEFSEIIAVKDYEAQLRKMASGIKKFSDYLKEEKSLVKLFTSVLDDDKRFNGTEQPVVGVSWYCAKAYCLWLSLLKSNGGDTDFYRLPNEVEWEWAAGGQRDKPNEVLRVREYPWNSGEEPTKEHANYNEHEGQTTPVGRYPKGATPEGLYDMAGNVWEWCEDWYDESTRSTRVLRGGGWNCFARNCRSAYRHCYTPDYRNGFVGFRLVFVP